MYAYVVTNTKTERLEHTMGTKEGIDYYDARQKVQDEIDLYFPDAAGWKQQSLLVDDEPIQFLEESSVSV